MSKIVSQTGLTGSPAVLKHIAEAYSCTYVSRASVAVRIFGVRAPKVWSMVISDVAMGVAGGAPIPGGGL